MKHKTRFPLSNGVKRYPRSTRQLVGLAVLLCAAMLMVLPKAIAADEPNTKQIEFFEKKVRPLLVAKCFECHADKKQSGSLRLDRLGNILEGGDSGPALVPGHPEESLLVEAINYESYEMPPSGKLEEAEIQTLTQWVKLGAPWPATGRDVATDEKEPGQQFSAEDRGFWSFQPVTAPSVPEVADARWNQNPVDRFIHQKLTSAGLKPAPPSDRVTLIRRVYFDLVGLPPSPKEIAAFINDNSPDAFSKVVERLLESPRYGEQWGRHWLDLVRYAESDGFNLDGYRPEIWRYRDYVVQSFNDDKPYPQFVTEQLAGDEVAPHDPDALAATGYLRHYLYEYNQRDARTHWSDILNDVTDVTGDVFLGMGMGCARCHDHKFDPILQKDYFRLQAFFTPILPRDDIPFATAEQIDQYQKQLAIWEENTAEIRGKIDAILAPHLKKAGDDQAMMFPPDVQEMINKDPAERTGYEHQIAELALRQGREKQEQFVATAKASKDKKWSELQGLYKTLAEFDHLKPAPLPHGMTVVDVSPEPQETYIPDRKKAGSIEPGYLSILDPEPAQLVSLTTPVKSSGRRSTLAQWISNPDNPLTTRVMANRVWQYHFGTGLVASSSDFGRLGEKPSHPELLDWLTKQLVENNWSVKHLHRLIVNSETYKLASAHPDPSVGERIDPLNRLHWRGDIRRLQAEQIRDASLAVSGELDLTLGGPSVDTSKPRRSIYTIQKRNTLDPFLGAFDLPGGTSSTAQRNVTTTPTQALLMINGDWLMTRAAAMAKRLLKENSADDRQLIVEAYRAAVGREPEPSQLATLLAFLEQQRSGVVEPVAVEGISADRGAHGLGAALKPGSKQEFLRVNSTVEIASDFTVEAVLQLDSMFEDASVRTVASQWNGNTSHRGWSLGVTSKKSAYKPGNLILQLVGDTKEGTLHYEVVPSGIHLELGKTYYVSVAVDLDDTTEKGVRFVVKDLAKQDEPQRSSAAHTVVANFRSNAALVIGGRDGNAGHRWDGVLDEIRLSGGQLADEQLAVGSRDVGPETLAFWRFETDPGFFANSVAAGPSIAAVGDTSAAAIDPIEQALTDLCHVLLNSNQFLYVD